MNSKFLKLITTSASALALAAVVSFAAEPQKDGEKCPCPSEKPKTTALVSGADCPKKCDKDKKDAPAAPATASIEADNCPKKCDKDKKDAPAAPATAEDAPAKKDGDKCPCPSEKPKA
jgi:hypothetical protein